MEAELKKVYYDPSHPAGFSTANKLYEAVKTKFPNLTLLDVHDFLKGELTYTLHKPSRVRFPRNKILSTHAGADFQADLADMSNVSRNNDGYKYILVVVDVFSKFAYAFPLKTKGAVEMRRAFEEMFQYTKPETVFTDAGTEFTNAQCQQIFSDNNITFKVA